MPKGWNRIRRLGTAYLHLQKYAWYIVQQYTTSSMLPLRSKRYKSTGSASDSQNPWANNVDKSVKCMAATRWDVGWWWSSRFRPFANAVAHSFMRCGTLEWFPSRRARVLGDFRVFVAGIVRCHASECDCSILVLWYPTSIRPIGNYGPSAGLGFSDVEHSGCAAIGYRPIV